MQKNKVQIFVIINLILIGSFLLSKNVYADQYDCRFDWVVQDDNNKIATISVWGWGTNTAGLEVNWGDGSPWSDLGEWQGSGGESGQASHQYGSYNVTYTITLHVGYCQRREFVTFTMSLPPLQAKR